MLATAKLHATVYKNMDPSKLVVCEYCHRSTTVSFGDMKLTTIVIGMLRYLILLCTAEAWVTKGPKQLKRIEPRGRGKFGIRVHPDSRMHVILRPGKTYEQVRTEQRERRLKRIVSAGLVREDVPLRNPASFWQW